ncbi:MAG: hypothetical protein ACYC2E_15675 [Sulfuricella sp.]
MKLELQKEHVLLAHMEATNLARAQWQPLAMISGLREIGKLMGFYNAEVVAVSMNKNGASLKASYEAMSDAELMAVIAAEEAA